MDKDALLSVPAQQAADGCRGRPVLTDRNQSGTDSSTSGHRRPAATRRRIAGGLGLKSRLSGLADIGELIPDSSAASAALEASEAAGVPVTVAAAALLPLLDQGVRRPASVKVNTLVGPGRRLPRWAWLLLGARLWQAGPVFSRIAIVNRGEAAMRLIHAVRELNAEAGASPIETVALYTDVERTRHLRP